jgi:hypothetical protein
VVGNLPELNDREPNDTWRAAQRLEPSAATINGRLTPVGDCDVFAANVRAGQTLVAWLAAERPLASPMDGVLQILDSAGIVVAENHDFSGLDPCVAAQAKAGGVYYVRLFAFPAKPSSAIQLAGGDDFIYRLTVTSQDAVSYAFPLSISKSKRQAVELRGWNLSADRQTLSVESPADRETLAVFRPDVAGCASVGVEACATQVEQEPNSGEHFNALQLPVCVSGTIGKPGDEDTYSFAAEEGQTVDFRLESAGLGFPLDATISLADADGNLLATADDSDGRRDPELMYTSALAGEYRLTIRDLAGHGGWRYAYRLRGGSAAPDFALRLGAATWSTSAGSQLDIPLVIERRNSCEATIRLTVAGLPATAACQAVESRPGESSSGTATLRISAGATPFAGPIQIVGRAVGESASVKTAQAEIEGFGVKTDQLWLTISKAAGADAQAAK